MILVTLVIFALVSGSLCESIRRPKCGEFEEPTDCADNYPQPSANEKYKCQPGCKCIDKYARDPNGVCVPRCNPCRQNETFANCNARCETTYCPVNDKRVIRECLIPRPCPSGCVCLPNYKRLSLDDDRCVLASECPPQCGKYEEPTKCATNYPQPFFETECKPGCKCIEKYMRDANGTCIPVPPELQCGKNEEPSYCKQFCPPQRCDWDPTRYACKPGPCRPGCNCIWGYVRDKDGNCIPKEKCPPTPKCGKFEEPTDCADNSLDLLVYDSDSEKCKPGCKCIDGYLRDINGTCSPIPSDLQCGKNEEPTLCVKVCFPQICNVDPLQYSMTCKPGRCQPGCQCIKGHVRDETNTCIPKEKCPPIETPCVYDECTPTCSIRNPPNCPRITTRTTRRCNCSEGHILSEKGGVCVPFEQCPKYENCKGDKNAYYTDCPNKCRSTCRDPEPKCEPECGSFGCECKAGYIWNDEGKCILPQDCPGGNPCSRNQTFANCNVECPTQYCPKDDFRGVALCLPRYPCPGACVCQSNYRRLSNDDKRCILASDCPPVKCTRQNEVWNSCPDIFADSCSELQRASVEIGSDRTSDRYCQPQCVCAENYRRNGSDVCVPIAKCPPKCGEFEEPTDCADYPVEPYDSGTKCQPGCKCIDKYLRDLNGTCVPVPSDLKCGKNEEPTLCVKVCFPQICNVDPLEFSMTCKPGPCQPGCQCIKGYVRDEFDNCIPKEKCPPVKTPCTFDECSPTCSIRKPPNCSQANNSCSCSDGFILSEPGGQCVPTYECSVYENCKGDKNARYSDCPNKCKSTCRDPEPKCVSECDSFGCECKPGYILNDDGKCILPQDCPGGNPCKKNEEFSYCKVECAPSLCPQDDFRGVVLCLPQYPCPSGCVCKRNYRRLNGDDKRCVLASECPAVNCTRQFEVWNPCTGTRFSDSCRNLKRTQVERTSSGPYCQPQCACTENYLRNDTDVCVPVKECPQYSEQ